MYDEFHYARHVASVKKSTHFIEHHDSLSHEARTVGTDILLGMVISHPRGNRNTY